MSGFAAIVRREIAMRRMVIPAALAASVIPFLVPLVRGLRGGVASEARIETAFLLSAAFVYGLVAYLAGTGLPRAIADRRIGFDLARPVSTTSIWAAPLAAALALGLSGGLIAWAPTAIVEGVPFWPNALDTVWPIGLPWPATAAAAALLLYCVAQAVSIAVRSPSALLMSDLVAGVLASSGAAWALARVGFTFIPSTTRVVTAGLIATGLLAALASVPIALSRGRTDIRAAHRAMSVTAWGIVLVGLAAIHVWISWLFLGTPRDLTQVVSAKPAPAGSWTMVGGTARRVYSTFLYDAASRRFLRLPRNTVTVTFSDSGDTAAWFDSESAEPLAPVWCAGLSAARPEPRLCASGDEHAQIVVLNADGRRVAVAGPDRLTIHATDSGAAIVSVPLPARAGPPERWLADYGLFVGPVFRLYRRESSGERVSRLRIYELSTGTRLVETGAIEDLRGMPLLISDRAGERMAVKEVETRRVRLVDGRSGRTLAWLADAWHAPETPVARQVAFLSDARLLLLERDAGRLRLRVFSRDGGELRAIPLSDGEFMHLGGEVAPGRVAVGVGSAGFAEEDIHVVDVDAGSVRLVARHLAPAVNWGRLFDPPNQSGVPGSPGTRLFLSADETLVELDPSTGERRLLLGRRELATDRGRSKR
jgi:hypothetical protein